MEHVKEENFPGWHTEMYVGVTVIAQTSGVTMNGTRMTEYFPRQFEKRLTGRDGRCTHGSLVSGIGSPEHPVETQQWTPNSSQQWTQQWSPTANSGPTVASRPSSRLNSRPNSRPNQMVLRPCVCCNHLRLYYLRSEVRHRWIKCLMESNPKITRAAAHRLAAYYARDAARRSVADKPH